MTEFKPNEGKTPQEIAIQRAHLASQGSAIAQKFENQAPVVKPMPIVKPLVTGKPLGVKARNPYLNKGKYPEEQVKKIFQYVDDHPELNLREVEKVFGLPEDIVSQLKRTRPDLAGQYQLEARRLAYPVEKIREIFGFVKAHQEMAQKEIDIDLGLPVGTISQLKRTQSKIAVEFGLISKKSRKRRKYSDEFVRDLFSFVAAHPELKFNEVEKIFSLPECTISNLRQTRPEAAEILAKASE